MAPGLSPKMILWKIRWQAGDRHGTSWILADTWPQAREKQFKRLLAYQQSDTLYQDTITAEAVEMKIFSSINKGK